MLVTVFRRRPIRPFSPAFTPAKSVRPLSTRPELVTSTVPVPTSPENDILIISLNRPESRNALSRSLVSSLSSTLSSIHAAGPTGRTRAVVVASSVDSIFCAGADLKERRSMTDDDTRSFLSSLRSTFSQLETLPVPSIAAVAGTALGGGLELALASTLRVFASSTVVGLPETRLAIIPGAGGTYRLPSVIGLARARDLILTGRRVSAPEAYFLGLCNRLVQVPSEASAKSDAEGLSNPTAATDLPARARQLVLDEAVRLAAEIAAGGPVAIHQALGVVGKDEAAENAAYEKILVTSDRLEALAAFAEKRKPVYTGK